MGDIVGEIFGWVGSVLATIFYLAPVVPFYNLIKKKITYQDSPGVLLLMSFFNCILWGVYGLREDLVQVWVTNFLGCFITLIFIIIYLIFVGEEKVFLSLIYNFILLNFVVEIFYVSYSLLRNSYVGNAATTFNILMYAAPGEKIYQVYKTGNYNLLPIVSSICGLACASSWAIYGIYQSNWNLIIPNVLGIAFSLLQIVVWWIFYSRKKPKDNSLEDSLVEKNDVKESNSSLNQN